MSEHRRHPAGHIEVGQQRSGRDMRSLASLLVPAVAGALIAVDVLGLTSPLVGGHPVLWAITVRIVTVFPPRRPRPLGWLTGQNRGDA